MNPLLTAIYGKTSGSTLSSDVGGRIFLDSAPDGCEFPYIVFFIVSNVPDWEFVERFEDTLVQFSLFSSSSSAVEITAMYSDLKALFDDCSMAITGDTLIWFRRQNLVTMVDEITVADGTQTVKVWHVDYEVKVQS